MSHTNLVIRTLQGLGLHFKKSDLLPTFSKQFIGYVVDTNAKDNSILLKIPHARIQKLRKDINRIRKRGSGSAEHFSKVKSMKINESTVLLCGQ